MLERAGESFLPANTGHPRCVGVVYVAVLGYMVQGGLPGKHRESQEIRLLFPVVSICSCNGALSAMCAASLKHDTPHLGQVLAPLCRARCAVQWEGAGR